CILLTVDRSSHTPPPPRHPAQTARSCARPVPSAHPRRPREAPPMASVLLCSTPVHAHVTPLLAVTRALVARGHDVRFLTGARFAAAAQAAGAEHVPLPAEADFDDLDLAGAFPGRAGRTGLDASRHAMLEIFVRPGAAQPRAVLDALARRRADAVLVEPLFLGAMALVASPADRRPPVLTLGIVPLGLRSERTAPVGLGVLPARGRHGVLRNPPPVLSRHRGACAPP